jgi:two-component system sensor histidine kinase UhpB
MVSNALVSSLSKFRTEPGNPSETRESPAPAERIVRALGSALLVGTGYYIGTRVGFALTPNGQPNSTFWPPNAILLAAFLLAPRRLWWTFLITVFPAHMFAQLQTGVPLWTSVGWFLTNISEALIGAFCITRLAPLDELFDSARGVFVFLVFGVIVAPLATSFLDAAAVVLTGWGHGYWPISTERFWTNALAELTVVPAIVLCGSKGHTWIRKATLARCLEVGLLAIGTVFVTFVAFGFPPVSPAATPALLYAPLPILMWATIRFGSGGLSLSLLCTALMSIWYTMHGREPFPSASMPQNILSLQILLCMVAVLLLFLSATMADARRTQDSLRSISGSLINAQEQERHRIARELHDDLGQGLALAQVRLEGLIEESSESLKPGLTDLSSQLSAISTTAREVSHGLYPSQLEYLGLATAVKKLCDEMQRGRGLSIDFAIGNLPRELQPSVSLCLYRVAQEALHNIITHSQAKNVQLALKADKEKIWLRIIDDGVGFDARRTKPGLGLPGMCERVRLVNGTISIESKPMGGTTIHVRVSLESE